MKYVKTHNKSKKNDAHFINKKYVHILKQQNPLFGKSFVG